MLRKSLLVIMANLCVSGFLGCGNPQQCLSDKDCKTCERCDYGTCRALICETPDEARCVDDNTLWVFHHKGACTENECAYGHDEVSCAKGCDSQAASCRECSNGCSYVNSTLCQGGKIQTCMVDDLGCLQWSAATDCPNGSCQGQDSCGACENECPLADQAQCAAGRIRTCVPDALGCLKWGSQSDCQDGFCTDANNCGVCDHNCSATGLAQCQDGKIRSCDADSNGCRHWSAFNDCQAGFCQDEQSCGSCANQCTPAGVISCHNGQYKRCAADNNGCLIWGKEETCAEGFCADGETCGTCDNQCPSNQATQCQNGQIRTCTADAHGCLAWGNFQACDENFCADDQTCGVCTHHQSFHCYSHDVYWYDSCGTREEMKEDCIADKCTTDSCDPGQCLLDIHCSQNEYCNETTCEINPNSLLSPITDGPLDAIYPRLSATLLIYEQKLPYDQKETRVYDLAQATNVPWTLPFDFNFYYTPLSGNRVFNYYIGPNFNPREYRVYDIPSGGLVGMTTPDSTGCTINGYDYCFCDYSVHASWQALHENTVLIYQAIACVGSGPGYDYFGRFSQWDFSSQQIQFILEKPIDENFQPNANDGVVPYDGSYAIFHNLLTDNDLLLDISSREIRDAPLGAIPMSLNHGEILVRKYDSPSNAYRLFAHTLLNSQEMEVTPSGGPGQFNSPIWLSENYILTLRINEGMENGFYLTDRTTLQERLIARTSASADNVSYGAIGNDFNGSLASFVQYHQPYHRVVLFSAVKGLQQGESRLGSTP